MSIDRELDTSDLEERIQALLPRLAPHEVAELAQVTQLIAAMSPERIYAFGSHARGEAGPDSDVDLMVIVSESNEPGYRRDQAALAAIGWHSVPLDVLVWTHAEFEKFKDSVTSLSGTIRREGRILYDSA